MAKDLTNSRLDRQNILNNEFAVEEIRKRSDIQGYLWENKIYVTREMAAQFFEVDVRTIGRYVENFNDELTANGYQVLRGKKLKAFLSEALQTGKDINVLTKTTVLGLFDFRSFLNLAMLLSESDKARLIRQMMLDVVIDVINQKTGGGSKYINQRDGDFLFASLQEDNYRRKFTDALKNYVEADRTKYGFFTDMIYISIFKENAREYKKILDLKAKENVRDTFYSEILNMVASYENGLAAVIQQESEALGRVLTKEETKKIFREFESNPAFEPLIHNCRMKMASRDMAFREAFHYRLSEYIQPLDKAEYNKFLGVAGEELERLMIENQDVLQRLKERG